MRWSVLAVVAAALSIGACQSGGAPVTPDGTTSQTSPAAVPTSSNSTVETGTSDAAGAPASITATVTYTWAMITNDRERPNPQILNAKQDTTCALKRRVDTCDSPGPFKGSQMTVICFDDTVVGGIIGVVIPEGQLVRPDQLHFRSKQGQPVGFTTIDAIGGWNYPLFSGLATKLGVTVENGLQCAKNTVPVQ